MYLPTYLPGAPCHKEAAGVAAVVTVHHHYPLVAFASLLSLSADVAGVDSRLVVAAVVVDSHRLVAAAVAFVVEVQLHPYLAWAVYYIIV